MSKKLLLLILLLASSAGAQIRHYGPLEGNNAWTGNNSFAAVFDASNSTFSRPFRRISVAQMPLTCLADKDVVWVYDTATAFVCNTLGTGWVSLSGGNPGTVTTVSSGNALPLFTATFTSPTSTPSLVFSLSNFSAHKFYGNNTSSTGLPAQASIGTGDLPFTYSGNTTILATITGTKPVGQCLEWGSGGNIVTAASGLACGAGGGGGGSPGGALTSIQYNNLGAFGGFGTWDGTLLTIPGSILTSAAVGSNGTFELGLSSSTTQNWLWAHSADGASNTEPGFLKASASPADAYSSHLFPCSSAGHWCMSSGTPGADSANYIPALADIQAQNGVYYIDTGAANVYAITPAPAIGAYAAGQNFVFKAANANTLTNPTLNVSGLGTKVITKNGTGALAANDIKSGQVVSVMYDGTQFQMTSQTGNASGGGGTPGGSDTQVQFNDAGIFGGSANFIYNKTTGVLSLLGGSGSPSVICGSGSATVPCSIEGDSGDAVANAEAAYLKLGTSPANTRFNYFYPSSAAGRFCFAPSVPAQDCTGTLADYAAQISDAQNQLGVYYADSGSSTAYVITPNPAVGAYATGQRFVFKAGNANTTTTPTLAVSGLAAKTIMKNGTFPLTVGDIKTNQLIEVMYDGTQFEMTSLAGNAYGRIDKQDPAAGVAGDGTDKTLYTYSMPAGTLAAGRCARVTFFFIRSAGVGSPTFKISFGATAVASYAAVIGAGPVSIIATVCNNVASTTAQWAFSNQQETSSGTNSTVTTPAENTNSGSIVIKGTFNVSAATSVASEGWLVELI